MKKQKQKSAVQKLAPGVCFLASLVILACAGQAKPDNALFSRGMGLEQAVSRAQEDLADTDAHPAFGMYFQRLLEIAQGNPDPENKRIFSQFLVWANQEGILTRRQSQDYYNRYFNITFMSLPDDYSVSASCPDKADMISAMGLELAQKEEGLVKACKDKESYYLAYEHYKALITVLDATCLACARGK